jgi:hypothetical protein
VGPTPGRRRQRLALLGAARDRRRGELGGRQRQRFLGRGACPLPRAAGIRGGDDDPQVVAHVGCSHRVAPVAAAVRGKVRPRPKVGRALPLIAVTRRMVRPPAARRGQRVTLLRGPAECQRRRPERDGGLGGAPSDLPHRPAIEGPGSLLAGDPLRDAQAHAAQKILLLPALGAPQRLSALLAGQLRSGSLPGWWNAVRRSSDGPGRRQGNDRAGEKRHSECSRLTQRPLLYRMRAPGAASTNGPGRAFDGREEAPSAALPRP